jgi:hypothetical protein
LNVRAVAELELDQRWVMSGMLNLSRNLGLVTGASAMAAVFALASAAPNPAAASTEAVARGMRITILVAAAILETAVSVTIASARRDVSLGRSVFA